MEPRHRRRRRVAGIGVLALVGLASAGLTNLDPGSPARAAVSQATVSYQPVLGLPATDVEVIGASPGESSGEAWAQGQLGVVPATVDGQTLSNQQVLMQYTDASGSWQIVPVDDASGQPIPVTKTLGGQAGWDASAVTQNGGVALIGTVSGSVSLVTRDPGGAFSVAPSAATGSSPALLSGETLLSTQTAYTGDDVPLMTAFDEGAQTGVLIAPGSESATTPGILHYVGGQWSRESVCASDVSNVCVAPTAQLTVDAISASAPGNAWLIGTVGATTSQPVLFERVTSGATPVWVEQQPSTWLLGSGAPPTGESAGLPSYSPILTAVGQGVWVDLQIDSNGSRATDATVFLNPADSGEVAGTWCYPIALCPGATGSLGGDLPDYYGSFAWPDSAASGVGTRVITGLPDAVELNLSAASTSFSYTTTSGDELGLDGGGGTTGPGGETLTSYGAAGAGQAQSGGAAFDSTTEGWFGSGLRNVAPADPSSPAVVHVTTSPGTDALASWPVPFRDPLLAISGQPGTTPDDANAEALAVGVNGEVARYLPGTGWVPEYLYSASGAVQTPTLRGVAWPEANLAFAVGDDGAMWRWNAHTALWEPDPAKPIGFQGSLEAIAFSPSDPDVGYAVGKQGTVLAYGKTWTQQSVPSSLEQATLSSVAFAGSEALVAYRIPSGIDSESGGVLINNGSGWQVDPGVQALMSTLPSADTVITKVAGLPDGGAVAAGPGVVLERDSATAPWQFANVPLTDSSGGNISALAAYQSGSSVDALVSVDIDPESDPSGANNELWQEADNPPATSYGQPPLLLGADPLPSTGYLLRQSPDGWSDEELDTDPNALFGFGATDLPVAADPVLALWTDVTGDEGWAVGGETGGDELQLHGESGAAAAVQTAGVMRFGTGPTPPTGTSATVAIPQGQATFAFGGDGGCANPCADDAAQQPGPEAWLQAAVAHASGISGLRAFLVAGQPVSSGTSSLSAQAYDQELAFYDQSLSVGGSLPVYAVASAGAVTAASGGAAGFAAALGSHVPAGTSPNGTPAPPAGTAAYAFNSTGSQGGTVRVIVLDYSANSISGGGGSQLSWLVSQLKSAARAGTAAIVVGADSLTDSSAPNYASDASVVSQDLLNYGASAYLFYDASQQNVSQHIGSGANQIPAYGTGTLGYVLPPASTIEAEQFLGASGYLLLSVNTALVNAQTNRAPVSVQLIPNTGQLAIDAVNGTLLRRSSVSLFEALARRPQGGGEWVGSGAGSEFEAPDPYTQLPEDCLGTLCSQFIAPAYSFSSSNPQVGNFVAHDPNSSNPDQIALNSQGLPVADDTSGLFCAFNPGTTTVTLSAGGLSYSVPVTVQSGSVRAPCGTVEVTSTSTVAQPAPVTPAPQAAAKQPAVSKIKVKLPSPPPPPPPPPAVKVSHPLPVPRPLQPIVVPVTAAAPPSLAALFPVTTLTPRPTPPTGFSSVVAPAPVPGRVFEEERDEEAATESASAFAAYHPAAPNPMVPAVVVIILLLAIGSGGAGIRRGRRRGAVAFARADTRSDRGLWERESPERRRPPWRW